MQLIKRLLGNITEMTVKDNKAKTTVIFIKTEKTVTDNRWGECPSTLRF